MNSPQSRGPAPSAGQAPAAAAPAPAVSSSKRKPALLAIAAVVVLAGIGYGAYYWIKLRHYESTDNAYVQANLVQVTPQVGGTVTSVLVNDTDTVKKGQLLVKLDPADAKLALERAKAQLAQVQRQARTLYTATGSADANVKLRDAEILKAETDLAKAQDDVNRRRPLVASGAVSAEEMKHAETALAAAKSALVGARSARAAAVEAQSGNKALIEGYTPDNQPSVLSAQAAVHEAQLTLERTELRAAVDGQVARRSVQVGQHIAAGAPLMTVIPLSQVWVEANFKEGQLRQMRVGQKAELTADLYGNKVRYEGTVVGLGAGTGAAFALLPAQNATGNWIKVVQRVPVRIALDPQQLAEHPLRVGLSMEVTVDLAKTSGESVMAQPAPSAASAAAGSGDAAASGQAVPSLPSRDH
jgi:membrane fusion protein (multidrug efflux system)